MIESKVKGGFMSNCIYTAPVYKLEELNNLFIELTAKNCNQRCSSCYIDFPMSKNVKDFISIDKIKEALNDTKFENLYCIYLTGAEPMTHPDFNTILRLCLKRCNVCICTNASFLNEKKIRFLKKVEEEQFNLIFKEQEIINTDIQITVSYPSFDDSNFSKPSCKTDCMHGRILCQNGIYACPFLANDYRGRAGSSFKDYSKNITAETDFCATCSKITTICSQ